MPQMSNQYASENPVYSTAGTASTGHEFGFVATALRVANDKASPVYVSLNTLTGSTNGHRTCAGESWTLTGVATGGIGLASTTTSTGTAVRVAAWG